MPFLRMQAERGNRAGLEAAKIDRLIRLDTIAIAAVIDTTQRRLDFLQQLALAVMGAKVDGSVAFDLRTVHLVRPVKVFLRQIGDRLGGLGQQLAAVYNVIEDHQALFASEAAAANDALAAMGVS